jgi:hypothetical protein
MTRHRHRTSRAGFTLLEFAVIFMLLFAGAMVLLVAISQAREQARMVSCRRNLSQIGFGLALYEQIKHELPAVGQLTSIEPKATMPPPGPLEELLHTLDLPDLTELSDASTKPSARAGALRGEVPVPGFMCPADRHATSDLFSAPVSYRASAGDSPAGDNGAFAPGRKLAFQSIDGRDGLSFTAAFSERLVGDGQSNHSIAENYALVLGPLEGKTCPPVLDPSTWRGDAGSSWIHADYRSTLYSHALPPGGSPSCIARDGGTALIGASSGHSRGTHLLLLDGNVNLIRTSIDPNVWRQFATVDSSAKAGAD